MPLAALLITTESWWLGSSHCDTYAENQALAQLLCSLSQTQATPKMKVNEAHYQ